MSEFEVIYKEYFRDVELYLLALCKDESLAEELTAQAFYQALRSLPKFRGDCDISTWLCAIAKNVFVSHLRKQRTTVPVDSVVLPDPDTCVEERVMDKMQARIVRQVLHELPEPYKEVFSLRVYCQLSFTEIGELFGKSQNWACVTYHRARQKIQNALGVTE